MADRRDLTRAAEFVASMPGDQAQQFSGWLAAEMKQLDETVGPAEDGRQEHAEKMSLTLDLADDVEQQAAEGAEAQLEFYAWAMEQFGGRDDFFAWANQQEDPKAAIVELAEEYLLHQRETGVEGGGKTAVASRTTTSRRRRRRPADRARRGNRREAASGEPSPSVLNGWSFATKCIAGVLCRNCSLTTQPRSALLRSANAAVRAD